MKQPTLYTVIFGKRSCMVKYATSPAYETKLFSGSFANPDLAHQTLKQAVQGPHSYLVEEAFEKQVSRLSSRYQKDMAKLADWKSGKAIQI
jgi:hypothetical protein